MINVIKQTKKELSLIVHLGDCVSDFKEITKHIYDIPCISLKGNNDIFYVDEQEECIYNFDGVKCLFTHGHRYGVKAGLNRIIGRSIETDTNLVAFGHTHSPMKKHIANTLFINPGTIGGFSMSLPTFATINIANGKILSADIYEYNPITNSIEIKD